MRVWGVAAFAVAIGWMAPVHAQDGVDYDIDTALDLQQICSAVGTTESAITQRSFCYGFLSGAGQFYRALMEYEDDNIEPFVCPKGEVTRDEAVGIYLAWAAANPDRMEEAPIDALFRAWSEAFPCP